jgi:hypothetical protein
LNALAEALDIPPACLAILGSRSIGRDKVATQFMKELQRLISSVLLAQKKLGAKPAGHLIKSPRTAKNPPRRKPARPKKIAV